MTQFTVTFSDGRFVRLVLAGKPCIVPPGRATIATGRKFLGAMRSCPRALRRQWAWGREFGACQPSDHLALKSPLAWSGLRLVGYMESADESRRLELRDCPRCFSTLAIKLAANAAEEGT